MISISRRSQDRFSNLAVFVLHLHRRPAEVLPHHVQEQIIRYKLEVKFCCFKILTFSRAVLERFMVNSDFVLYNSVDRACNLIVFICILLSIFVLNFNIA